MSKATKWRKVGNEWRRGILRVTLSWDGREERWWPLYRLQDREWKRVGNAYTSLKAAMRAADRWAARMLKELRKMEGGK